jgi:hypothetical protein
MEIVEAGYQEYSTIMADPYHIFGSAAFNHINEDKAESVHYLLFKDGKYRLGIIGGVRNNHFVSPFSAPFGGFSFLQEDVRISYIDEAVQLLTAWAKAKGLSRINITLPPFIYQESFLSKQINSLYRNDFTIEKTDLNYAYDLRQFNENYPASTWYNARKNLKIALANNFSFRLCETADEKETAYNIIKQNREARGFPLRMTWQQVQLSASLIPADFFLVFNSEALPVAAAVVFHLKPGVVQVIYWGDLPEYAGLKTMNFLSFKVFEYYHQLKLEIIDIGPSTENSIPNYGLCEFKESIGCGISCKFSLSKSIA